MSDATKRPWVLRPRISPFGHPIYGPHGSRGRDEAPHVGNIYREEDAELIVQAVNAYEHVEALVEAARKCEILLKYAPLMGKEEACLDELQEALKPWADR